MLLCLPTPFLPSFCSRFAEGTCEHKATREVAQSREYTSTRTSTVVEVGAWRP